MDSPILNVTNYNGRRASYVRDVWHQELTVAAIARTLTTRPRLHRIPIHQTRMEGEVTSCRRTSTFFGWIQRASSPGGFSGRSSIIDDCRNWRLGTLSEEGLEAGYYDAGNAVQPNVPHGLHFSVHRSVVVSEVRAAERRTWRHGVHFSTKWRPGICCSLRLLPVSPGVATRSERLRTQIWVLTEFARVCHWSQIRHPDLIPGRWALLYRRLEMTWDVMSQWELLWWHPHLSKGRFKWSTAVSVRFLIVD